MQEMTVTNSMTSSLAEQLETLHTAWLRFYVVAFYIPLKPIVRWLNDRLS